MTETIGGHRLLHVYGGEIISYENSISEAFQHLAGFLCHDRPPASLVHGSLRRILADAGLVSLVFFPTRDSDRAAIRAEFLRTEFEVDESSILRSRAIRNHLFHLDERLDRWAMESSQQTFGRGMLGSRADATRIGLDSEDILGLFDPGTLTYSFLQDDLQVDDLVGEIRGVSHRIRRRLRSLPWDARVH